MLGPDGVVNRVRLDARCGWGGVESRCCSMRRRAGCGKVGVWSEARWWVWVGWGME